ncbi:MAG: hypothetical protein LBC58_06425 [Clostridiales Family XIII bacterium]|nr:hypothetical protein [Clostridiales Family XIII bacterium]
MQSIQTTRAAGTHTARRRKARIVARGVACAAAACVAAALLIGCGNPATDAGPVEKNAVPEQAAEITAPKITGEITDDETADAEDVKGEDAGELAVDTAPKPDEGREVKYSIQQP